MTSSRSRLGVLLALVCACSGAPSSPGSGVASAEKSSFTVEPAIVAADGSAFAALRLVLHDANDRALARAKVSFAELGGVHFDPPSGVTDSDGVFSSRASSVDLGDKDVVLVAGSVSFKHKIQFVVGPPDRANTALTLPALPVASDGTTPARLTLRARDAQGHAISGAAVMLTAPAGTTVSPTTGATGADGTLVAVMTSNLAGDFTLSVTVGPLSLGGHVIFSRTAPSLARSSISATPSSAPAGTPIAIAVAIRDVDGNALGGVPLHLVAKGIKTQVDPADGATRADGTYAATLTSTFAETKAVAAQVSVFALTMDVLLTGAPWQRLDLSVSGSLARAVAFDPSDPTLAIAPGSHSIFRSTDAGHTWTPIPRSDGEGMCVVFAPGTPDVYACVGTPYVSHDRGLTWSPAGTHSLFSVRKIAVAPGIAYFAFEAAGVYTSTDRGATLVPMSTAPTQATNGIAVDPSDAQRLYLWADTGFYISADAGQHWTTSPTGLPPQTPVRAMTVDPSAPAHLYTVIEGQGLYRSTDSGATWSSALPLVDSLYLPGLAVDPANGAVYFSVYEGLYKSSDHGSQWQKITMPMRDIATGFAFDAAHPGTLLAASLNIRAAGVFRSTDSGVTWTQSSDGMDEQAIDGLAADPFERGVALASIFGVLSKTTDAGGTWQTANTGLPVTQALQLEADPSRAGTYFAQVLNDGIYKTDDWALTWRRSTPAAIAVNPQGFTVVRSSPTMLLAAERYTGRAYASTDRGDTWSAMGPVPLGIDRIHACAAQPQVLFGAGAPGIFRSADGGSSWTMVRGPTGASDEYATAVNVDPAIPDIALVTFGRTGLIRTMDAGRSWTDVTPTFTYGITATAVAPSDPATVFVNAGGSIWRTHDRGTSWGHVADGLDQGGVEHLAISGSDPLLVYAGTIGWGLWRTSTGGD